MLPSLEEDSVKEGVPSVQVGVSVERGGVHVTVHKVLPIPLVVLVESHLDSKWIWDMLLTELLQSLIF